MVVGFLAWMVGDQTGTAVWIWSGGPSWSIREWSADGTVTVRELL